MIPEHLRFGGGSADSLINPLVAVWLLIAIVLIFALPRAKVITPFLIAFFTIPIGQVVVVGGFHFTCLRILILAGIARGIMSVGATSKGWFPGGFNGVDRAVVVWAILSFVCGWLEFKEIGALVSGLGGLIDNLCGYLVVRSLILDGDGVRRTIRTFAVVCLIQGLEMIYEQITHVNVFGILGGMYAFVVERDGRFRSAGVFGYLWAGAFAGVLIPMFLWLWNEKKSRLAALAGLFGATAMVITSNSSTSLLAFMGGFVGLAFWPLRRQMRQIRWGMVALLIGLDMVMKAPVWALIARVDLTGSSSAYQRYGLVDMTIRHFSDWWLIGTPNYIYWGWDSWDLCNQFVAVGLTGGLLTLIFYILIFSRSFGAIGRARKVASGDRRQEWFIWCWGATLLAIVVAHFGINYMAQLIMGLFPILCCISVVTFETRAAALGKLEKPTPASIPTLAGSEAKVPVWASQQNALSMLACKDHSIPSCARS
jgi:hypothetical protein